MSNKGFTLIEAILTMLVFTVIMSCLPLMYKTFSAIDKAVTVNEDYEWNLFLIQLRNELAEADLVRIGTGRIYLYKDILLITYEKRNSNIRRQVGERGHEIVLQQVEHASFYEEDGVLHLVTNFTNGTIEEARFLLPDKKEDP